MPPKSDPPRPRVLDGIAVTVAAVWAISHVVALIDPQRAVPSTVDYIMGALVSALFGVSVFARRDGANDA
jgi:hypothetical protein